MGLIGLSVVLLILLALKITLETRLSLHGIKIIQGLAKAFIFSATLLELQCRVFISVLKC